MIVKKTVMQPLTSEFEIPLMLEPLRQNYRIDIFYDDSWDYVIPRTPIVHFSGAGVNEPYKISNSLVKEAVSSGFVLVIPYYYQPSFSDPNDESLATGKPIWNESIDENQSYQFHLRGRVMMVQTALDFVVNNLENSINLPVISNKIYLSGKSRGGATLLCWSFLSRGLNHSDKVKLIINSQGFLGTDMTLGQKGGWLNWFKTISTMSLFTTWGDHNIIHSYNDKDTGDYDFSKRLMYSIPNNKLAQHTFVNFVDDGHNIKPKFIIKMINDDIKNEPFVYEGKSLENLESIFKKNNNTNKY